MSVKIFFCYAHEDEELLNKLKAHLTPLQRQGLIATWHDRDINAGDEWEQEIKEQLNSAQIILLLVSPAFIVSDYVNNVELKRAIERHDRGEARVIPIILRHVYWRGEPLGKLRALPTDGKPVISIYWHDEDEAFFDMVEGIRKIVLNMLNTLPTQANPSPGTPSLPQSPQLLQTSSQSSSIHTRAGSGTSPLTISTGPLGRKFGRKFFVVSGSVIGAFLVALGSAPFLLGVNAVTDTGLFSPFGSRYLISGILSIIVGLIVISLGVIIFCRNAVTVIGRYTGASFMVMGVVVFIGSFLFYGRFAQDCLIGGVIALVCGYIFYWGTRTRKW